MITKVQLPMAREALVLAANQGLLYVLAMVVIGGMVGAGSLGYIVVSGFSQDQLFGKGLAAGIAIAALGIMIDRIARYAAARYGDGERQTSADPTRSKERKKHGTRTTPLRAHRPCHVRGPRPGRMRRAATSRSEDTAAGDCGELNIAVNPWTGYVSNAHVIGMVAEKELGCKVEYPEVKEEVGWQGMSDGSIDTIVENWGHPDLIKKYIDDQGTVVDAGLTGNDGIIGWYVPPWMAEEYPDILDWENLNEYADMFETSESDGKGQLLDGDPSYVTNDEALVKNLDLDFKVVVGGSEAALHPELPVARRRTRSRCSPTSTSRSGSSTRWTCSGSQLPPYEEGCDADAAKVDCDYPPYKLNKLISKEFADSDSPAVDLIKNFNWTNEDQNTVSTYIAQDGMDPDDAAAEVDRGQPGQGGRLARVAPPAPSPVRRAAATPRAVTLDGHGASGSHLGVFHIAQYVASYATRR